MATIKIEGAIWAIKYSWMTEHKITWRESVNPDDQYMLSECCGVMLCRHDIEVEIDVIDVAEYVNQKTKAALIAKRNEIAKKASADLRAIDVLIGAAS